MIRAAQPPTRLQRRGLILAAVLMTIALLAVVMASFAFFVEAEANGTLAYIQTQQARLTQDSAMDELSLIFRDPDLRHDPAVWFHNPERFRHRLVWSPSFDRQQDPVIGYQDRREVFETEGRAVAWRWSLVAPWDAGDDDVYRFGITPESAKLNLNVATEQQLRDLIEPLLLDLGLEETEYLIAALLDWRDTDDEARENGAEAEYYSTLEPPYQPKNGPFTTVEELLLVKGFSAAILWGEDTNRNGMLDPNEDDAEETFPAYDNADGELQRGIAPFLTVWSRETDVAYDNKPRINLNTGGAAIRQQLEQLFEQEVLFEEDLSEETISFLTSLTPQTVQALQSPADLFPGDELPEEEEEAGDDNEAGDAGGGGLPSAVANSPVLVEEMNIIMERFSTRPADEAAQVMFGRININAAPREVLLLVPGMDVETADAIIASRRDDRSGLLSTGWPLVRGIVDAGTFRQIAPYITTKAFQIHIEIVAYADHTPLRRRTEWVVELAGPLMQTRYRRDLTELGPAWPVDRDEETLLQ